MLRFFSNRSFFLKDKEQGSRPMSNYLRHEKLRWAINVLSTVFSAARNSCCGEICRWDMQCPFVVGVMTRPGLFLITSVRGQGVLVDDGQLGSLQDLSSKLLFCFYTGSGLNDAIALLHSFFYCSIRTNSGETARASTTRQIARASKLFSSRNAGSCIATVFSIW